MALAPVPAETPVPAVISAPLPEVPGPTPPSAHERAQAESLVRSVVGELPHYLTVAVVDITSGQILAGQWAGHSGGAVEVAAANAELMRQAQQAIEALQLSATEQLEDVLITLRHQLYLLRRLPQQDWLLYLAMRAQDTNLGLARTVLRTYAA